MMQLPEEVQFAIFWVVAVGVALVGLADLVLLAVWLRDSRQEKPLLAPRWSLAHLFFAMQIGLVLTMVVGLPITGVVWWLLSGRLGDPTREMAWSMLPLLVVQNLAMIAVVVGIVR